MILKAASQVQRAAVVSLRCPICQQVGTFDGVTQFDAQSHVPLGTPPGASHTYIAGLRSCPNPACRALVLCIVNASAGSKLVASYPPERLDFDATNIPNAVARALGEAITWPFERMLHCERYHGSQNA